MKVLPRIVLILGLAGYLLIQTGLVIYTDLARPAPVEVDDAYSYIVKAVRAERGFQTPLQGIDSLREQLVRPSTDKKVAADRYRIYLFVYFIYHPMYSVAMSCLHFTGLNWELAFAAVRWGGSCFLAIVMALWLRSIWGNAAAGLAMGLLAFTIFSRQGLHYIVPSNLTMGGMLLMWTLMIEKKRWIVWILLVGLPVLGLLHKVGYVCGLLTVSLFLLTYNDIPLRRRMYICCLAGFLILATWCLARVWVGPDYSQLPDPLAAQGWSWSGIMTNISGVSTVVGDTFLAHWKTAGFFLLGAVGLVMIKGDDRRKVWGTGVVLALALAGSLIHVLPKYPAELFSRFWIPAVVFAFGATGYVTWTAFCHIAGRLLRWQQSLDLHEPPGFTGSGGAVIAFVILVLSSFLAADTVYRGSFRIAGMGANMIERQCYCLDKAQVAKLRMSAGPLAEVLYGNEIPMLYYLAQGAESIRCSCYKVMEAGEKRALPGRTQLRYLAVFNPLAFTKEAFKYSGAVISAGKVAEISSSRPRDLSRLELLVHNYSSETADVIIKTGLRSVPPQVCCVPARSCTWIQVQGEASRLESPLSVSSLHRSRSLILEGVKTSGEQVYRWPWDQGVSVKVDFDGASKCVELATSAMCPELKGLLRVVDDQSAIVLSEVLH